MKVVPREENKLDYRGCRTKKVQIKEVQLYLYTAVLNYYFEIKLVVNW